MEKGLGYMTAEFGDWLSRGRDPGFGIKERHPWPEGELTLWHSEAKVRF